MAWAISTPPPTRCSAASWRSRFSPIATRRTSRSASGSHGRRWRPPASPVSRTPSRSSTSASTTDVPTSSWSTSAADRSTTSFAPRARCPPERVFTWLEEAARALDVAHREGVVHRDVKPANLLLDAEGHVHVADFGIASAAGMHSLTMTGTVLGTAGYLSPEQARGERAGPASDRYALAIVAWELLTGRRPFESESPTAEAAAHVNAPIPVRVRAAADLPCELDPVFTKALAKDPADRYGTANEFVAALRGAFAMRQGRRAHSRSSFPHRRRRRRRGRCHRDRSVGYPPGPLARRVAAPRRAPRARSRRRCRSSHYLLTTRRRRVSHGGHPCATGDDAGSDHDGREAGHRHDGELRRPQRRRRPARAARH